MIVIRFADPATKRRALGYLAGRFSFKSWANSETVVAEIALADLARAGIRFTVEGPATDKTDDAQTTPSNGLAELASDDVLEFCRQKNIVDELNTAVGLAAECFWNSDTALEKANDPETDDPQVVISVSIQNRSREEVLAAYRAYRKKLTNNVPWPQRGFIRLSYDLS